MDDVARPEETVVAPSAAEHALIWVGFPVVGAVAGWLLEVAAVWITTSSWMPLPGWIRFVVELAASAPHATPAALGIGAVAGLVVAAFAKAEQAAITVRDDDVRIHRDDTERRIERSAISAVFLDGKQLVIQGERGDEPLRETTDLDANALEEAFRTHAYPWTTTDPRGHELRRWVPDLDRLPAGAGPLLTARQQALDNGDTDDAAQLRSELAAVGIVVRDEGKSRQFVRRIDPEPTTPGSAQQP